MSTETGLLVVFLNEVRAEIYTNMWILFRGLGGGFICSCVRQCEREKEKERKGLQLFLLCYRITKDQFKHRFNYRYEASLQWHHFITCGHFITDHSPFSLLLPLPLPSVFPSLPLFLFFHSYLAQLLLSWVPQRGYCCTLAVVIDQCLIWH